MARRSHQPTVPLSVLLACIAALPRDALEHLAAGIIDRIDGLDPDTDLEECDEDRCSAGDDDIAPVYRFGRGDGYPGDADDAEDSFDREYTDEREPELYAEGGGSGEIRLWGTGLLTA